MAKQQSPRISVIIPTYNRADLLPRAIASVLEQTFTDFELLVIDDGSTDTTAAVMATYDDPRITYLPLPHNAGVSHARNVGITKAVGDYIALLDSDDQWLPDKLEKQLHIFSASLLPNLGVVSCLRLNVDQDGKKLSVSNTLYRGDVLEDLLKNWMQRYDVVNSSIALVKREVFDKVGVYDESMKDHEDYDLWIRMAKQYDFDMVNEALGKCYKWQVESRMSDTQYAENKIYFFTKNTENFKTFPAIYASKAVWLGVFLLGVQQVVQARGYFLTAIQVQPLSGCAMKACAYWLLSFTSKVRKSQ